MLTARRNIAVGACPQLSKQGMIKASPDLRLPASVVAFDGRLKAGFTQRHENNHHAKLQTHACQSAITVRTVVRPLEDRVIVELNVVRTSLLLPVAHQACQPEFSCPSGSHPARAQASVHTDRIEDFDLCTALDHQPFDDVDTI